MRVWVAILGLALLWAQVKLRVGSMAPQDSPWEEALNTYIKTVEKEIGPGKVTFRKFLGGQLGGEVEMVRNLRMGTLDVGMFSVGAMAEGLSMPELLVLELPFLFESEQEADYVMDALFDEFKKRLMEKDVILVFWGVNGWRHFGCSTKPILSPADLKGLKMRAQEAPTYIEMYKVLGATPVPLPMTELLMALKNRMVDGYDQTVIVSVSLGLIGQIKHFTLSRHVYQPGALVISKKVFDKLSPEVQKALLVEKERPSLQATGRKLVREEEEAITAAVEKEGNVKFYRLSPQQRDAFRKVMEAAMPRFEAQLGPQGKVLLAQVKSKIAEYRKRNSSVK